MPALVFVASRAIGLPPIGVAALTLTAACPTGVNVFLIASRLGTGQALASNTLLISTAAGVVTVTLWLSVVQATLQLDSEACRSVFAACFASFASNVVRAFATAGRFDLAHSASAPSGPFSVRPSSVSSYSTRGGIVG